MLVLIKKIKNVGANGMANKLTVRGRISAYLDLESV